MPIHPTLTHPIPTHPIHTRGRRLTGRIAATFVAVMALMMTAFLSPARAATSSATIPVGFTSSANLGSVTASTTSGDFSGSITLSADTSWSETGALGVTWNPDNVRQGRALDPGYRFDPASGLLTMTYSANLHGTAQVLGNPVDVSFTVSVPMTGVCMPDAGGHYATCSIESGELTVLEPAPSVVGALGPLLPKVTLKLVSQVQISDLQTSQANRSATSGGAMVAPNAVLQPSESVRTDDLTVGCRVGAGDILNYAVSDFSAQRTLSFATGVQLNVDVSSPVPIPLVPYPDFPYINVFSQTVPLDSRAGTVNLNNGGGSVDMGALQANNIAPVVSTASSYMGVEGSPVAMTASATGPCAAGGSYVWRFSDGSTEYGPSPHKTFTDNGAYTGSVTFTDVTGLSDTTSFSVTVSNAVPALTVTPDNATLAWGRPLSLKAQAIDPGTADQSSLTYAWTFDDGTAISDGGATETHQWAAPGTYQVGLTVCDKDGGCTTSTVPVTVTARTTTTSYTGDNAAAHSATATLSASVTDEFGMPVQGAAVAFTLGVATAEQASTGASGGASRTQVVGLVAGSYDVSASYAGSALYVGDDSATESFQVSVMGSTLTYTGAVTGKPNKVAPVSVRLVDALGRPLASQTVTIAIGTQSTTVTTNSQGVGTGSIKLTQKPGSYPVQASWAGVTDRYAADDVAGVFKLNTK
ncbi:PKD domain-containing protein [Aestuariimicrobium soli]|uniref:PKD domain-containing protein n=1 Tax=Aestuariimicrobium soli TaxID=2035834 RepID=UPI003EBE9846